MLHWQNFENSDDIDEESRAGVILNVAIVNYGLVLSLPFCSSQQSSQ